MIRTIASMAIISIGGLGLMAWSYVKLARSQPGSSRPASIETEAEDAPPAEPYREMARDLMRRGEPAAASIALDRALEEDPDDGELVALQVRALSAQNRHEEAMRVASRFTRAQPTSLLGYILSASIDLERGNVDGARSRLATALALDPASASVQGRLARLALMQGRAEDARRLAASALAIEPEESSALTTMLSLSRSVPELVDLYRRLPRAPLAMAWVQRLERLQDPVIDTIVTLDAEVVVPLELREDGRPVIRASLEGRENLRLLVDTGASGLVIAESLARDLGWDLQEQAETVGLVGGTRHVHPVIVDRIAFGPIVARRLRAIVSRLTDDADGIINPLALARAGGGTVLTLDPAGRSMSLRRWPPGETPAPPDAAVEVTPYLVDGVHPIVPIRVKGRQAHALLDTGAAVSILDRSLLGRFPEAEVLAAPEGGRLVGIGGPGEPLEMIEGASFELGTLELSPPTAYILDLEKGPFSLVVDLSAIIGADVLGDVVLRFDPDAGVLGLSRHGAGPAPASVERDGSASR